MVAVLGAGDLSRLAPGARIVVRDEEWLVRAVDTASDGGRLLSCDGVTPLVRGRNALFFTGLEQGIEVLDPALTRLANDASPHFNKALLHLESTLRRTVPNDTGIHLGDRAVMNLVPYQLDPALKGLAQARTRILIADAVGLGKTLEAGILATELIQRGRGKRILVITLKSMLTQFQKEFWSRFTIPLVRLDSVGLARVRNRIPANHNPFNHYDRTIISIDTLKNNLEYRNHLENAWWDIIIIDECHNVAARAGDAALSRRARLARLVAQRSDTLILLSATPHDGSARSFASLVSLLDPTVISDPDDYTPENFRDKGLVVRRFKKDIRDQVAAEFQERAKTELFRTIASLREEEAYKALVNIPFTNGGSRLAGRQQELQRISMQKGLFSSPAAALQSLAARMNILGQRPGGPSEDEAAELTALDHLNDLVAGIDTKNFSKYQRLLQLLRDGAYGWSPGKADDRLVIFSERLATLQWLKTRLVEDMKLPANSVVVLDGGLPDTEQNDLVDRFGRLDDPVRVLLCSDVASEGLNLHYFCHRLIHFDLPWSLMIFQQRNGRVDRYGQKYAPRITYLTTETTVERIKGDMRILEVLQRKDDQAARNLGDPGAFLNIYDPDKEAIKVADLMATGESAEEVERRLDAQVQKTGEESDGSFLLSLFNASADAPPAPADSTSHIAAMPSLFAGDYEYARTAIQTLDAEGRTFVSSHTDADRTIRITAPPDLQQRLRQIPREAQSDNDDYTLTDDRTRMADAIEKARQARAEDDTWPQLHYLWRQHPIMEWLRDRTGMLFGRHTAPVIRTTTLAKGEAAFLMLGMVPNRKAQPLLLDLQAVVVSGKAGPVLEPFADFVARAGLRGGALPNPARDLPTSDLEPHLRPAVEAMGKHMRARQQAFAADMDQRLKQTLDDLDQLQRNQLSQLALRLERTPSLSKQRQREGDIHRAFDAYRDWVRDTMTTEPQPYLQVLAVVAA